MPSKKPTVSRVCLHCQKPFLAFTGNVNRGWAKFCSRLCAWRFQRPVTSEEAKLKAHISPQTNGCHLWTGPKANSGYGLATSNQRRSDGRRSKTVLAHRLAYELAHGPIPKGLCVLHRCDVPACVNPEHLFLGTHKENTADMRLKGRHPHERTHWRWLNLPDEQLQEIRNRYASGEGQRKIAAQFGISKTTVARIVNGETRAA